MMFWKRKPVLQEPEVSKPDRRFRVDRSGDTWHFVFFENGRVIWSGHFADLYEVLRDA